MEDWFRVKIFLKIIEGFGVGVGPFPDLIFFGKSMEGRSDFGKVLDEASIEIRETEESLDIVNSFRFWPVQDTSDLLGIHAYSLFMNTFEACRRGHFLGDA